jgi:hypothetical protein
MPKQVTAFVDAKGNMFKTAVEATLSDITILFGNLEGMAPGIARVVFEKRAEIEKIYSDYDYTQIVGDESGTG